MAARTGRGGPGRPKKYNAATLGPAIDGYFSSLTKANGSFKRPPSLAGLCLCLGISRQTLLNYANGDDAQMAFLAESARLVVEDFWSGELAGKWANGAKFALGSGFGWNERGRWSDREEPEGKEEDGAGVIELAAIAPDPSVTEGE